MTYTPSIKDWLAKNLSKEKLDMYCNTYKLNATQIGQLLEVDPFPDDIVSYGESIGIPNIPTSWSFYDAEYKGVLHQTYSYKKIPTELKNQWITIMYKRLLQNLIVNIDHYTGPIYYIDEDHNNNMASNCQFTNPYPNNTLVGPFTSITKTFEFEYSHFLPGHQRKCKFLHGHRGQLEVTIRRRVNMDNGFVTDFSTLKNYINDNIIDVFDHNFLNQFIAMPTCENTLLWIWQKLGVHLKGIEKLKLYEQSDSFSEITKNDVLDFIKQNDHIRDNSKI